MKNSNEIFIKAKDDYSSAEVCWNKNEKEKAGEHYLKACYGMMQAFLVSDGMMHMKDNNSIHKSYEKIIKQDANYVDSYAMEFNYLSSFYNKKGYFKNNPEMDINLKNDLSKLYEKLKTNAIEVMKDNKEDKIVEPKDIEGFIDNITDSLF